MFSMQYAAVTSRFAHLLADAAGALERFLSLGEAFPVAQEIGEGLLKRSSRPPTSPCEHPS